MHNTVFDYSLVFEKLLLVHNNVHSMKLITLVYSFTKQNKVSFKLEKNYFNMCVKYLEARFFHIKCFCWPEHEVIGHFSHCFHVLARLQIDAWVNIYSYLVQSNERLHRCFWNNPCYQIRIDKIVIKISYFLIKHKENWGHYIWLILCK